MKLALSRRWLLEILGLVLVALFIWLAGPLFEFNNHKPLDEFLEQLVAIALVILLRVAWLLAGKLRKGRATDTLMASVAKASAADAGRPSDEALQLRERFEEAVATLKQNQRRGRGLYDLPWYVFIGAPGSGKTTALVNSGLKFPLEQRMGKGALRGVGGTRNCDWWFTDEAVFLDTAGRYTTQDSDAAADSAAWSEFLKLLRQYRKRRPLNGVILTISAHDLMTLGPDGRAAHVAAARRRLDELNQELRVRLPVYVFVTKSDLVDGFTEYFGDLTAEGRAQVWGITFSRQETEGGQAAKALGQELDAIMVRLNERLFARLEEEVDARRRTRVFGFPQQMAALRPLVDEFVTEVFGSTRFDKRILLRGVYFTSGTQEGTPIDRLLSTIGRRFGMASEAVVPAAPGRGKAFFIENLLKNVLLGESGIAGLNWLQELRLGALLLGAYVAMVVVAVLGVILLSVSYRENGIYLQKIKTAVDALALTPEAPPGSPVQAVLPRLDALRMLSSEEVANRYRASTPLKMRWGLFQGSVGDSARAAYIRELGVTLVPFVKAGLERRLADATADPVGLYAYLKAYLMLGEPEHLKRDYLSFVTEQAVVDGAMPSLADHVKSLLEQEDVTPPKVPLDESLVERARGTLKGGAVATFVYNDLKAAQNGDTSLDIRLQSVAGMGAEVVLRRRSGRSLSDRWPGMFTLPGFKRITAPSATAELIAQFISDSWVWGKGGPSAADAPRLTTEVLALYEDDYIRQWKDLIQDIETVPSMQDAQLLGILAANPGSPLRGLLKAIDENTYLAGPSDKPEPSGAIASAKRMLGNAVKQGQAAVGMPTTVPGTKATAEFGPIHQLMAGAPGSAPIDRILGDLQAINLALLRVGTGVGQTSRADPTATQQLNALLATLNQDAATLPPSIAVWFTQVGARTQKTLSSGAAIDVMKQYRQDVQDPCLKAIQGRYPFDRGSGTDVPIADFGRVFGSRGVFDSFFQQTLLPLVDTAGPSWAWRAGVTGLPTQMLRQFQTADALRKMFFPSGTVPRVEFTLTMSEALGGVKKVVLDIDGKPYEYLVGAPKSYQAVWPDVGPPQAQARFEGGPLGVQATSPQNRPWAWFHVLDSSGANIESNESLALRMAAGAYSVKVRIAAASISNPFTDSRWRDFSCGGF